MQEFMPFCNTDRQREILQAVIDNKGQRAAARALNTNKSNIDRVMDIVRKRAALQGHSPEHDMKHTVPDGFKVKGVSTLYKDGAPVIQWVKSSADDERRYQMMLEAIEALTNELPQIDHRDAPITGSEDLMAIYPIGDAHIGMRAWHSECGADWDLTIAEKSFVGLFDRLVKTAPHCKQSVIVNLGDWFHVDNISNTTERSGHRLDADGRYSKIVDVGVTIIRRMIESALEHHESVRVINAIGNHDDTGAMFLSVALRHMYEKEPRVTIDASMAPFHYIRHGKCYVGVHHGHTCKADKLPLIMATDKAQEWGETEHRYWYTGHIHHDTLKEYAGCKVESFRTIAGKDAYATWNGYRSGQDSKCIVLDRHHGEVERHTVNISMVR